MINIGVNIKNNILIDHYIKMKDYENLFNIIIESNINDETESNEYKKILEVLYRANYLASYIYLARTYFNENDINKGLKILKEGGELEVLDCIKYLGEIYYEGQIVEKDFTKAIDYYEKAALMNDEYSIWLISVTYLHNLYTYKGLKSLNIFNKGKKLNIRDSLLCLAKIHENPQGIKFDLGIALALKEKCLDEDNLGEVKKLAFNYLEKLDKSNKKYQIRMIELFEISANNNDLDSLCMLGYFYFKGSIVEKDLYKSLSYYQKAASLGDIMAQDEVLKLEKLIK